ncbi:L domain-like protein [Neocallimastix lanati (nom. inval.)]|jgi:Leucine-rich repeat (LRR) protein|nr:L domain-like protein [Neocallimastix sp. JGI-2020a]
MKIKNFYILIFHIFVLYISFSSAEIECDIIQNYIKAISNNASFRCDAENNIQSIIIKDSTMTQENFNYLLSFSNLRSIEFQSVVINSQLPVNIDILTNLEQLVIENCGIVGEIPVTINNLVNLKYINLSNNHIKGPLPDMSKLNNLIELEAPNNEISGEIPESLSLLSNLRILSLGNNKLSGAIPSSIGNMKSLEFLSFANNTLSGSIPSSIENLSNLGSINLSENQLTGSISNSFSKLNNVFAIYLNSNKFSGEIPEFLGNLLYLTSLNLSDNNFSGVIPDSLKNLSSVSVLLLNNNPMLQGEISNSSTLMNCNYENTQLCFTVDGYYCKGNAPKCTNTTQLSKDGKCGEGFGICQIGQCCSKDGICGTSDDFCDTNNGCQADFGKCVILSEFKSTITTSFEPTSINNNEINISFSEETYSNNLYSTINNDNTATETINNNNIATEAINNNNTVTPTINNNNMATSTMNNNDTSIGNINNNSTEIATSNNITTSTINNYSTNIEIINNNSIDKATLNAETDKNATLLSTITFSSRASNKVTIKKTMTKTKERETKTNNNSDISNSISEATSLLKIKGRCGKGYGKCLNDECCSKYGWCGKGNIYCYEGCQLKFGYCNTDSKFSTKTANNISITLNNNSLKSSPTLTSQGRCGSKYGQCSKGLCCSKHGWCGKNEDYCGIGCQKVFGNCSNEKVTEKNVIKKRCGEEHGKCENSQCCSKHGFCGTTKLYCSLSSGCQIAFGKCNK